MSLLLKFTLALGILGSHLAQADVHFPYPDTETDTINHPVKLKQFSTFSVRKVMAKSADGQEDLELIYIDEYCRSAKTNWNWQYCYVFGPMTETTINGYFEKNPADLKAIDGTLDQVDGIYKKTDGLSKAATQLAMIAVTFTPVGIIMVVENERLMSFFKEVDPLALVYLYQGRDIYVYNRVNFDPTGFRNRLYKIVSSLTVKPPQLVED